MSDGSLSPAAIKPAPSAPNAPAPVDLRPLTTSELIDRGFVLYRANFAGLLMLALLCQSAPLLGQLFATAVKLNPTPNEFLIDPAAFVAKSCAMVGIVLTAQLLVFAFEVILTFYIADAYLGRVPSVVNSMRRFTSTIVGSIWTCLLNRFFIGLTLIFPLIALSAIYYYLLVDPPLTLLPMVGFAAVALLLIVASLAPVLIIFMRLMLTVPALALEGLSGWRSIRRSSELVRYDPGLGVLYWGEMRLSFLLLPLFIIELMILFLTSIPIWLHQAGEIMRHGSAGQLGAPPDSALVISQILTFLAGSLILPLYSVATTLFYYDVRIRREGFDLEWMAAQALENK